jgi:hypothetical protein
MRRKDQSENQSIFQDNSSRREFLRKGTLIGSLSGLAGLSLVTGCKEKTGEEVTPVEDLMREHGVLERMRFWKKSICSRGL